MAAAELAAQAADGVMGLVGTLSSLKQQAIDKELSSDKVFTEEQRKNREAQAEKAFNMNKAMTLASISMQTSLAVIGALSDPTPMPFWVKAANATVAATTGLSSFASAASAKYNAPTAPAGAAGISGSDSNPGSVTNNTQNSQTTINITGGVGFTTDDLTALFDSDAVIINRDSAQGRALR